MGQTIGNGTRCDVISSIKIYPRRWFPYEGIKAIDGWGYFFYTDGEGKSASFLVLYGSSTIRLGRPIEWEVSDLSYQNCCHSESGILMTFKPK